MTIIITNSEYIKIHSWLKKEHGVATKCESSECTTNEPIGVKTYYHWCLRAGHGYEKKRENFIQLCIRCHKNYDIKHNLINLYEKDHELTLKIKGAQWIKIKEMMKGTGKKSKDIIEEAISSHLQTHANTLNETATKALTRREIKRPQHNVSLLPKVLRLRKSASVSNGRGQEN
jgi:hypothetical protein